MNVLKTIETSIDWLNETVGNVFGVIITFLVVLTVGEVILRKVFDSPTIWSFEVLKQLFALYFMITAAYGLLKKSHVSVDVFTRLLPVKWKAGVSIFSYFIFFFPFCSVGLWYGYLYAAKSWGMYEHSWSVFAPPLYPIKTVIPVTFALLFLQGISEVIKSVFVIRESRDD
jgi:TRAP-type mannitol/chloroaromatic compound transport system permease small subunit